MYHVLKKSNQLVNLFGYTNWIYIESLFSQSNRLKKDLNKDLSFLDANNSIKFYCMSLFNDVFNFVKIAKIYLPKEQYNTSMLIPNVSLLGIWSAKFSVNPLLFDFIQSFKE